jgi:hypothetical protein
MNDERVIGAASDVELEHVGADSYCTLECVQRIGVTVRSHTAMCHNERPDAHFDQ